MQEKIGNILLDYDCYSDGEVCRMDSVEEELLNIAKNYKEEELNRVIAQYNSWPVLFHFSHIRQNILEWMPITKNDSVLEIGSACGAVTGVLARKAGKVTCMESSKTYSMINAFRNNKYDNVKILVGNFLDLEKKLEETYDYITLIEAFEYAEKYLETKEAHVEMLRHLSAHLKPHGKIIIAIANRLGLKYWAGCTEDHAGKYFEGLEGYPETEGVKTFSRKELKDLIAEAGDFKTTFYYPYPDHRFSMSIYSDKYLPKKGELKENYLNFDRARMQLFDEPRVYDSLTDSGLFQEFSNSFLVVAERNGE